MDAGFWVRSFCGVVPGVLSSLTIILLRKRELVAIYNYGGAVCVLLLFLTVSWVGLRSVIRGVSSLKFKVRIVEQAECMRKRNIYKQRRPR